MLAELQTVNAAAMKTTIQKVREVNWVNILTLSLVPPRFPARFAGCTKVTHSQREVSEITGVSFDVCTQSTTVQLLRFSILCFGAETGKLPRSGAV